MLRQLDAEFTTNTPKEPGREGHLIFTKGSDVELLYVPLSGSIVFLADKSEQSNAITTRPQLFEEVLLADLPSYKHIGTIGSGQIAGLLEFIIQLVKNVPVSVSQASEQPPSRRSKLASSHLANLPGQWLLSGYAETDSRLIRFSSQKLIDLLVAPKRDDDTRPFNDFILNRRFRPGTFIKRCQDELAYRQALYLHCLALAADKRYDKLLALHVYEYSLRTEDDELKASRDKLAWLLGLGSGASIKSHLDKLKSRGLMVNHGITSDVYTIDGDGLERYYLDS